MSQGKAIGAGTRGTLSYTSIPVPNTRLTSREKIETGINGNPFIKNGNVDMGAIQSK